MLRLLLERSIQAIKNFNEGSIDGMNAIDYFEIYYEIEYKYSMLTTQPFTGVERRKENILSIIEETGRDVVQELANSFKKVYDEWLENHALNDPEKWAEQRYNVDEVESLGMENIAYGLLLELDRYDMDYYDFIQEIGDNVQNGNMPITREILEESLLLDIETEISLDEFIDDYGIEGLFPFSEGKSGFPDVIEGMDEEYAINMLQEIGQYVLFPAWYKFWKSQGIEKTRENIERLYKKLDNINSYSFREQLGIINQATNATHQTGSMMGYYEEHFDVGPDDLEQLSNQDVSQWNKELREIGVGV